MALSEAALEIGIDFDQLKRDLVKARAQFKSRLSKMQSDAKAIGKKIGGAIGSAIKAGFKVAAAGVALLTVAAVKSIQAMLDAEKQSSRLAKAVKASGMAAGFSAKEMEKFAGELQDATVIDDTDIKAVQAVIATFTNITGNNFKRATRAVLDMSEAMGTDLRSTAVQVAKALADPTKGLTALARSGVIFTQQQKELIKVLQETEGVAAAQDEVFRILAANGIDGNADATASLSDQWRQFKNVFEDIMVDIGRGVAAFFQLNAEGDNAVDMLKRLRDQIRDFIDNGGLAEIGRAGAAIIRLVGGAVAWLIGGLRSLGAAISGLATGQSFREIERAIADIGVETDQNIEKISQWFTVADKGNEKAKAQRKDAKKDADDMNRKLAERRKLLEQNLAAANSELKLAEGALQAERERAQMKANTSQVGIASLAERAQAREDAKVNRELADVRKNRIAAATARVRQAREGVRQASIASKEGGLVQAAKKQIDIGQKQLDAAMEGNKLLGNINRKEFAVFGNA